MSKEFPGSRKFHEQIVPANRVDGRMPLILSEPQRGRRMEEDGVCQDEEATGSAEVAGVVSVATGFV
jgi:hypothetical protein